MNSFNPLQMLMQMGQPGAQGANPLQQMMGLGTQQRQQIDPQKLAAAIGRLDKQDLANLVVQARKQGISEAEIEAGLNFLLKMR